MKTDIQILKDGLGDWVNKEWVGYYWLSHQQDPKVIHKEQLIDFNNMENVDPYFFVMEAMFFNQKNNESLVIKTIDDKRFTYVIAWNTLEGYHLRDEYSPMVRDPWGKKLSFKALYKNRKAANGEGYEKAEFVCRAFVGFQD